VSDKLALYLERVPDYGGEGSITEVQRAFLSDLLFRSRKTLRIGETGFNVGVSAATFLSARDDILVTSFDWLCYPGYKVYPPGLDAKREIDRLFPFRHTLIAGNTLDTLQAFGEWQGWQACFDLVFIDGGHVWPTPYCDIINLFMLLKPGGFIVVDDYCSTYGQDGVIRAWDTFCTMGAVEVEAPRTDGNRGWVWGCKSGELARTMTKEQYATHFDV
jgi:hypothetical protein